MIKHVVMWRLKEDAGTAAETLKAMLEALPASIPEIRALEVGLNCKDSEFAADVVLVSAFDSLDALAAYVVHPEHVKVGAFLKEIVSERRVVDYEV